MKNFNQHAPLYAAAIFVTTVFGSLVAADGDPSNARRFAAAAPSPTEAHRLLTDRAETPGLGDTLGAGRGHMLSIAAAATSTPHASTPAEPSRSVASRASTFPVEFPDDATPTHQFAAMIDVVKEIAKRAQDRLALTIADRQTSPTNIAAILTEADWLKRQMAQYIELIQENQTLFNEHGLHAFFIAAKKNCSDAFDALDNSSVCDDATPFDLRRDTLVDSSNDGRHLLLKQLSNSMKPFVRKLTRTTPHDVDTRLANPTRRANELLSITTLDAAKDYDWGTLCEYFIAAHNHIRAIAAAFIAPEDRKIIELIGANKRVLISSREYVLAAALRVMLKYLLR